MTKDELIKLIECLLENTCQEFSHSERKQEEHLRSEVEKAKSSINKYFPSNKKNRISKAERKRRADLAQRKLANPDLCYCPEDGIKVVRNKKDGVVCVTMEESGCPYPLDPKLRQKEPVTWYRCSNCGKKYRTGLGIAWA